MIGYPPLQIRVKTPRLELVGADDEMLAALAPLVRDGKVFAEPAPTTIRCRSTNPTRTCG